MVLAANSRDLVLAVELVVNDPILVISTLNFFNHRIR
jgi:hypothetical protein